MLKIRQKYEKRFFHQSFCFVADIDGILLTACCATGKREQCP